MRRSIGVAIYWCGLAAAGLPGLVAAQARADTITVYAFDFDFSIHPEGEKVEDAVIFAGDTIRWEFMHELHNTVACAGQAEFWESPIFGPGDVFVWTFEIPGVYTYYCAPHGSDNGDGTASGMWGTVTVLAVPAPGLSAAVVATGGLLVGRRRRVS